MGLDDLLAYPVLNLVSREKHRKLARKEEVVLSELHRIPEIFEHQFAKITQPVQVLLVVLIVEELIELVGLLVVLVGRLLSLLVGNLVQIFEESFLVVRGPRDVLGKPLLLHLLLSRLLGLLLLSPFPHHLELMSPCLLSGHFLIRSLTSVPLLRRRFVESITLPRLNLVSQRPCLLHLLNLSHFDSPGPRQLLELRSRFRL